MNDITLRIKRLDPDVIIPSYAYPGDAGLDLRSNDDIDIAPFERVLIPTGLVIAIPDGYAGFVQPRSGISLKRGLGIANTPGLIDSQYRGELKVIALNMNKDKSLHVSKGDRIAQLVIQRVPIVHIEEVDMLDETVRGESGFGSSGAR